MMRRYLIPRLPLGDAVVLLEEHAEHLRRGEDPASLVCIGRSSAAPNNTGGNAPSERIVAGWRTGVLERLPEDVGSASRTTLGRAIEEAIAPIPGDAAHGAVWSYLSLCVLPDVVSARWGMRGGDGQVTLPEERWLGEGTKRHRNYLWTSWQAWRVLGPAVEETGIDLGEDEFVQIMERPGLARKTKLAREVLRSISVHGSDYPAARSEFVRVLTKRLLYRTGAVLVDILPEDELRALVEHEALEVLNNAPRRGAPRRASE